MRLKKKGINIVGHFKIHKTSSTKTFFNCCVLKAFRIRVLLPANVNFTITPKIIVVEYRAFSDANGVYVQCELVLGTIVPSFLGQWKVTHWIFFASPKERTRWRKSRKFSSISTHSWVEKIGKRFGSIEAFWSRNCRQAKRTAECGSTDPSFNSPWWYTVTLFTHRFSSDNCSKVLIAPNYRPLSLRGAGIVVRVF